MYLRLESYSFTNICLILEKISMNNVETRLLAKENKSIVGVNSTNWKITWDIY